MLNTPFNHVKTEVCKIYVTLRMLNFFDRRYPNTFKTTYCRSSRVTTCNLFVTAETLTSIEFDRYSYKVTKLHNIGLKGELT